MITYNHENYIRQAVEGVLMQECDFEIELIIANDNSTDNSDLIINNLINNHYQGKCIKYINRSNNIGMQPNFIDAYHNCKGNYIALCEGDDYWTDPLKLQKQVDFLETNLEYVLCFHPVNILKTDGSIVDDFITKVPENYETIETLARLGNYIHTPSVVFRNVLKEFPFEFELSPIGDYFLYMMLAEHGKLKCLEEKMCVYREGVGILSKMDLLQKMNCSIKFCSYLASYLKDEKLIRIIIDKQIRLASIDYNSRKKCKEYTVSKHSFFKGIKYISHYFGELIDFLKRFIKK